MTLNAIDKIYTLELTLTQSELEDIADALEVRYNTNKEIIKDLGEKEEGEPDYIKELRELRNTFAGLLGRKPIEADK